MSAGGKVATASWRRRWRALLCLAALLPSVASAAPDPATSAMYAGGKDRVVQLRVIDRQAGGKAGIGSGFFAGEPGWVVSNYHVVAPLLNEPGRYEVRFLADDGEEGALELLAVDAVHDLALLRTDGASREPLPLSPQLPARGTRLWSMGYPFDIGLTIVEGTFNGPLQNSMYEKLHFTGSINPGMSGGPTLDAAGEVVGVNVSTAGNQVSFLVPVTRVRALIDRATPQPPSDDTLHSDLAEQLRSNQDRIAERLLGQALPVVALDGYRVAGELAEFVNCWGNSEQDEENRLRLVYYRCQTRDDIYLSPSLNTGIIQYQHDLVSTPALGPMRFYRQLEQRSYYPALRLDGDEASVTNYACQSDFVESNALPMKVTWCVRRYRRLEGLYDGYLSLTTLVDEREALQSTLVLAGFSWENLERFSTRFLEALSWNG